MANEYIDRLHEKRNRAWTEQREVVETALAEKRDLSAEDTQKIERLDAEIDNADAEIRRWQDREQSAREAEEARSKYEKFLRPEVVERSFEENRTEEDDPFAKMVRGEVRSATVNIAAAAREKQLVRAGGDVEEFRSEMRDLSKSGDASLIPTNYSRTLYDYLETYAGVRRTNPTVMTTADGNVITMPKVTAHGADAAQVTEGGALAEGDPTFGTLSLTSWKYGKLVQVSHELPRDAMVDVMGFVARDAGMALGRATGKQYILGDGTTEPEGVLVGFSSGHTGVAANAGVPNIDDLFDLIYSLGDEAYRTGAVFLTKDSNVKDLRKIQDADGRPMWEPSLTAGAPSTLLGYPVVTDTSIPAFAADAVGSLVFGNFSLGYIIRDVATIRFERSDDYAFANDLVTYRAIINTDAAVRDTLAVKLFTGGAAA